MQQVKTPLIILLSFFVLLFIYTKLAGPIPFTVNSITTAKSSLFMVSGSGKASAVPDTAFVSFGVTKTASTVEAAQTQVNEVANKITNDLKGLGIAEKDIQTTNYNVSPNYQYDPSGKQTTNGYTVSENVEVKIKPVEKANKAIDLATAAGANQVSGISFVLNDDVKEMLQKQATEQAIKNAKNQAQMLANAAGIKLGRIADIQTGKVEPVTVNRYAAMDAKVGGAQNETQLNPGENEVNITVTLGYETL